MNGKADIVAILIHTVFFWFLLILIETSMCIKHNFMMKTVQ